MLHLHNLTPDTSNSRHNFFPNYCLSILFLVTPMGVCFFPRHALRENEEDATFTSLCRASLLS
jgi:hypothetical protein